MSIATGFLDFARNDGRHPKIRSMAAHVAGVAKSNTGFQPVSSSGHRVRTLQQAGKPAGRISQGWLSYIIAPPQLDPAPAAQPKQ